MNRLYLGVPAGECFGLLGQNGAGKTSFVSCLSGNLSPDWGKVYLSGIHFSFAFVTHTIIGSSVYQSSEALFESVRVSLLFFFTTTVDVRLAFVFRRIRSSRSCRFLRI